jgi:hypothetical protein
MRLQDVLKEREQEIAHLEISLKEKEVSMPSSLPEATGPHAVDKLDSPSVSLSPRTINQFDEIKMVLQQGPGLGSVDVVGNPESDDPLDRLNELMRYVITSLPVRQRLTVFSAQWLKRNLSTVRLSRHLMKS